MSGRLRSQDSSGIRVSSEVFYAQLQQLPKDLFEDELLKGNFLGEAICQLLPALQASLVGGSGVHGASL